MIGAAEGGQGDAAAERSASLERGGKRSHPPVLVPLLTLAGAERGVAASRAIRIGRSKAKGTTWHPLPEELLLGEVERLRGILAFVAAPVGDLTAPGASPADHWCAVAARRQDAARAGLDGHGLPMSSAAIDAARDAIRHSRAALHQLGSFDAAGVPTGPALPAFVSLQAAEAALADADAVRWSELAAVSDPVAYGFELGIAAAASRVTALADDRVREAWSYDGETGSWEAPDGAAEERDEDARELAESIRSLAMPSVNRPVVTLFEVNGPVHYTLRVPPGWQGDRNALTAKLLAEAATDAACKGGASKWGPPLVWACDRWRAEVANRPLRNKHRYALDATWRQVVRYFGGDPAALLGLDHQDLVDLNPELFRPAPDEVECRRPADLLSVLMIEQGDGITTHTHSPRSMGPEALAGGLRRLIDALTAEAEAVERTHSIAPPAAAVAEAPAVGAEAMREACALIAERHTPPKRKARSTDTTEMREIILAEENGERIAAVEIAKRIRAIDASSPVADTASS